MKHRIISKFYRPLIFLLLFILILSCSKKDTVTAPERSLSIITDVHYLSEKLHDSGKLFNEIINDGDGKNTFVQKELLSSLIENLRVENPSALLITGDLTFNGAKLSHKELVSWLKKIESTGIDVFVIPGNHDINNPWAREFLEDKAYKTDIVSPETFRSLYKNYGYSGALSYDTASLSYLIEPVSGIQIFMLDSNIYDNNLKWGYPDPNGRLKEETRTWIKKRADIAAGENKKLLVAMHHSLIEHNIMVSTGYTIEENQDIIALFSSLHINTVLSGHIHIQDIIEEQTEQGMIYDITTSAFPVFPHKYGVLEFSDKKWVYHTQSVDVEKWAVKSHIQDEKFLNFQQYSKDYFTSFSHKMVNKALDPAIYTASEISDIAQVSGILNVNFFSGTEGDNPGDLNGRDLGRMFQDSPTFLQNYLQSILSDTSPSDNYFVIDEGL